MDLSLPNRQRALDVSGESPVKSCDDSPTDTPRKRKRKSSEPRKRLTDFSIKRLCFDDSPRSSPATSVPDVHAPLDEEHAAPMGGSPPSLTIFQDRPEMVPTHAYPHSLVSPHAAMFKDGLPLGQFPYPLSLMPYPSYSLLSGLYPGLPFPLPSPGSYPSPYGHSPHSFPLLPPRVEKQEETTSTISPTSLPEHRDTIIKRECDSPIPSESDKNTQTATQLASEHNSPIDPSTSPSPGTSRKHSFVDVTTSFGKNTPVIIRNGTAYPFTANSAAFVPLPSPIPHNSSLKFDSPTSCNASESGSMSPGSSHGGSAGDGGSGDKRNRKNYKNMTRERRVEANARERSRVHTISAAFEELRNVVPTYSGNQKLSKLAILRIACSYILALARLAGHDYSIDQSNMSFEDCVELCSSTIQNETKPKRR